MKTLATILVLAAVLSVTAKVQAAGSSLELLLIDDKVVFNNTTNISMEVVYRNVGETNLSIIALSLGLSVVFDGKEYKATRAQSFAGFSYIDPKQGWRVPITLSDDADSFPLFLIPRRVLTSGRHKVAIREAGSKSNTMTIFIEPRK